MRFYFSSCYSLGNRQTIFSCLIKSETNPRRDQTLFLFFALLLWPQGSKAFRICQTLRVFIYKMSIRDRHTKKAVHTGPSESATSQSVADSISNTCAYTSCNTTATRQRRAKGGEVLQKQF